MLSSYVTLTVKDKENYEKFKIIGINDKYFYNSLTSVVYELLMLFLNIIFDKRVDFELNV